MANLNYWAYWVGEMSEVQSDDSFMSRDQRVSWSGSQLLEHLLTGLSPTSNHAELNIHTLWALLLARPGILQAQPRLRTLAAVKLDEVTQADLTARSRQELASVGYAIRLADR